MRKFIIFGGDGFLGFEITRQLLDDGYEVIHYNILEGGFSEDKLLLIGRNSNFYENAEIENIDSDEKYIAIFPVSDWLFLKPFEQTAVSRKVNSCIDHMERRNMLIKKIYFIPTETEKINESIFEKLKFLNDEIEQTIRFYLPILYGEYMPENSLFSHCLTDENISRNRDILNVTDAVRSSIHYFECRGNGHFLLKNKNINRWNEIYQYVTGIKSQIYGLTKNISKFDQVIEIEETPENKSTLENVLDNQFREYML